MRDKKVELDEVIMTGEYVSNELRKTEEYVLRTNSKGLLGFFVGKPDDHLYNVKQYIKNAKQGMREFLLGIKGLYFEEEEVDYIPSVLNYFEFFFDDLINDYIVEDNAKKMADTIEETRVKVESILVELKNSRIEKAS